jgi:hypothetical protein
MTIAIDPAGERLAYVYADDILAIAGPGTTRRASHVEPALAGDGWTADLSPVGGPVLGPFARRAEALRAELDWLNTHPGAMLPPTL